MDTAAPPQNQQQQVPQQQQAQTPVTTLFQLIAQPQYTSFLMAQQLANWGYANTRPLSSTPYLQQPATTQTQIPQMQAPSSANQQNQASSLTQQQTQASSSAKQQGKIVDIEDLKEKALFDFLAQLGNAVSASAAVNNHLLQQQGQRGGGLHMNLPHFYGKAGENVSIWLF